MKKIILSALAIVAMASCTKENEAVMPNDGEVRICSSIATRTVGNTWEATDAIGLYMTTNGGEFGTLGENVKYTTATTNGNFTSTSPLYFPATGNVDLMAYYPYNEVVNISAYPVVNVRNQPEDQGSIDLMKAEASNVAKNSAAVNMTFKHKLARIKLNIKNGDGVTADALAGLAVTLHGTDTEATYDLTKADDATPITLIGAVADIEMLIAAGTDPYVRSAEAIVIPQALNGATLTFTTSDNTYISTLATKAFTIGNEYIYNVTIKKTTVAISSPKIDSWGDGNSNEDKNLDALIPKTYAVGDLYPDETTPIGVVYSISNEGVNGKVVSLDETAGQWSKKIETTNATDTTNGRKNMATIMGDSFTLSDYPAFKWCHEKNGGTVTYTDNAKGVWYLPAKDELEALYEAKSSISSAIATAEGTELSEDYYWSSTENSSNNNAWTTEFDGGYTDDGDKTFNGSIRAILAF